MRRLVVSSLAVVGALLTIAPATPRVAARTVQQSFGGSYSSLDVRRQSLVDDWVSRFNHATKETVEPAQFYDGVMRFSAKTTFEAITNALMTTALSDAAGQPLGDALDLLDRVDGVRGKVLNAASDNQFRMYVRLKANAMDTLSRSRQFKRRADNTVYHKGYPINFRGQDGTPSIQISIALDRRHADIDVDYRSSGFPIGMLNGHLTASNSDVRAGGNYRRHNGRWTGLSNWWQNFFGVQVPHDEDVPLTTSSESGAPRAGDKPVEDMMEDFLEAWLVEGDVAAAMGYFSRRAFECLAEDSDDPASFDRGMAPFVLARRLKATHEAIGRPSSIDQVVAGVRLTTAGLLTIKQPHHAQFVLYSVPDDLAARFDCGSDLPRSGRNGDQRVYGNYVGATFYAKGPRPQPVALLWARDGRYWKIAAWQTDSDDDNAPVVEVPAVAALAKVPADASLVDAAQQFFDSWLVRKDYDQAFRFVAPKAYPCYDLLRSPEQPASTSPDDAGRQIRAGMERISTDLGSVRNLDEAISAVEPVHPAVRVMVHRFARTFAVSSVPTALADAVDCAVRARGDSFDGAAAPEYGNDFGVTVRFRTGAGEPPVLRMLWARDNGVWRITAYDVETP